MKFLITILFILSLMQSEAQANNYLANTLTVSFALQDGESLLRWETPSEVNTSYFIIERSIDGQDFTPITTVKAKGHATLKTQYEWIDETNTDPEAQYRIILVTMEGLRYKATTISIAKPAKSKNSQILAEQ